MRVCLLYNFAQHYRIGIFKMLDTHFKIDFYFGNKMDDVRKMDYGVLTHTSKELQNKKLFSIFYWQKGALNLIFRKYEKYIIMGEYYCLSTWTILLLSKFYKHKEIYFWTHGWYGNESWIKKIVKKTFFNLADGILLYGEYAKTLMIENGFNPLRLHVVYNSLHYEEQLSIRKELKESPIYKQYFGNNLQNLVFVGRLTKVKELDLLLEGLARLNNQEKKYNLTIIGDGEMREKLVEQTGRLKIDENVWFYGASYDEKELSELLYNADLCVSPGNVGLTAIHAMSYGTPVITHNEYPRQMPEFEVIRKGENGDFFAYKQIGSFVETIENWFGENKNTREHIREKCFEAVDSKYNPIYQLNVIKNALNM